MKRADEVMGHSRLLRHCCAKLDNRPAELLLFEPF
jgi:hypothetical protein